MTDKFGSKMTNIEWLTDQAAKLRISANPCAGETPLTAMADRFDRAGARDFAEYDRALRDEAVGKLFARGVLRFGAANP